MEKEIKYWFEHAEYDSVTASAMMAKIATASVSEKNLTPTEDMFQSTVKYSIGHGISWGS